MVSMGTPILMATATDLQTAPGTLSSTHNHKQSLSLRYCTSSPVAQLSVPMALEFKFKQACSSSPSYKEGCSALSAHTNPDVFTYLPLLLQAAPPQQPPQISQEAPSSGITIAYGTGWHDAFIHYRTNNQGEYPYIFPKYPYYGNMQHSTLAR